MEISIKDINNKLYVSAPAFLPISITIRDR